MKVAVWDTYVTKKDGTVMHFDILVPEEVKDSGTVYNYGKAYLRTKVQEQQPLSSKECSFCHIENATDAMILSIEKSGYYIIEMEGCE